MPAPDLHLPGPEIEVLQDSPTGRGRHLRARLRSPRGAPRVTLLLPKTLPVTGAKLDGAALLPGHRGSWQILSYLTLPPTGIELELDLPDQAPFDAWLGDETSGIPTEGEFLQKARPREAQPNGGGDVTQVWRSLRL